MRFTTLAEWLAWQQKLNPTEIELGLDRVREVLQALDLPQFPGRVITVAGTNGKGSTVAGYETWLTNSGYRVASYTSPHLLRYNERIRLNREMVSDHALCDAFAEVDEARGHLPLTYFEFGTLAAMSIMSRYQPDYAVLEIGLGGRLDAVNVLDPELAHFTPIGLDHQDWLGETRDDIAREKAGILRTGILAVCNDPDPPDTLVQAMSDARCRVMRLAKDYQCRVSSEGDKVQWSADQVSCELNLRLRGRHQAMNLCGVMAGLHLLGELTGLDEGTINRRFDGMQIPGRLQLVPSALPATLLCDVGHNPDAARVIADYLSQGLKTGRVVALLGMLADKDHAEFHRTLNPQVDEWWYLTLPGTRGVAASKLARLHDSTRGGARLFESADDALTHAMSSLGEQDTLLVTGSFLTVEAVMRSRFISR